MKGDSAAAVTCVVHNYCGRLVDGSSYKVSVPCSVMVAVAMEAREGCIFCVKNGMS